MSNTTFNGPVRSADGFLEKDPETGEWVPVSGGGGVQPLTFSEYLGGGVWDGSAPVVVTMPITGVTPGSYTNATITVNSKGYITAIGNGDAIPASPTVGVKTLVAPYFAEDNYFLSTGQTLPTYARVVSIQNLIPDPNSWVGNDFNSIYWSIGNTEVTGTDYNVSGYTANYYDAASNGPISNGFAFYSEFFPVNTATLSAGIEAFSSNIVSAPAYGILVISYIDVGP